MRPEYLEAEVSLEVLGDLPNQTLEGELPDEGVSALLVLADLAKGHCAGPEATGLLLVGGGSS